MTGFGRAEETRPTFVLRVEARSVNNRSLKVVTRLHDRLLGAEPRIEKLVRERVSRGTVQVVVAMEEISGDPGYTFDVSAMRKYAEALQQLRKELGCVGEVTFDTLVSLPGTLRKTADLAEMPAELWEACAQALGRSLDEMVAMREEEGGFLWNHIQERRALIEQALDRIQARLPAMIKEYADRLRGRLAKLLEAAETSLCHDDFRREIAIFADRSDISEEIARMRSHLSQFDDLAENDQPVGRKLEFIAQELFREANTIGAKACDARMVHDALDIKGEVEKLREQAINLE